jgi:hypothetical protein
MALRGDEEVANKQVILKDYVMSGFPRNSDMNVVEIYCLKLLTCCLKTSSAHVLFLFLLE